MQDRKFWDIVDASVHMDRETQIGRVREQLSGLTKNQLTAFDRVYRQKLKQAWHWDLWAAAYILNDGCGDDGFEYFCDYLISRGRAVFEEALKDPESLIKKVEPYDTDFEEFRYVMGEVYEDQYGEELRPDPDMEPRGELAGEPWEEDEVYDRFPELSRWAATEYEVTYSQEWIDEQARRQKRMRLATVLTIIGLAITSITYLMSAGDRDIRQKISEVRDQFKTPDYFARLCTAGVQWYGQPDPTAQQVFDESLYSYQSIAARLPVEIRTEDGREVWRVVIETETDQFVCEDFADQYNGTLAPSTSRSLTKLETVE